MISIPRVIAGSGSRWPLAPLLPIAAGLVISSAPLPASGQQVLEQVIVVGRKPQDSAGEYLHGHGTRIDPARVAAPVASLADLVAREPGVAYSGQGGLFQTVSIRGLGGQRVGNFFLDIPITSERRAGTASSFIDPALLSAVEILRGPATASYGDGNTAGLIRSLPDTRSGGAFSIGWESAGPGNHQSLRLGDEQGYVALTHRAMNNSESAAGEPLHTEFEQYNLMLGGMREAAGASYELVSLVSYGEDIGKSNNRYPDQRVTSYPGERHWLAQLSRTGAEHDRLALYFHYQDLETEVLRPGERSNRVESSSLDFGARWQGASVARIPGLRWGAEYFGRRNVDADEWETPVGCDCPSREALLRGEQDQLSLFADTRIDLPQGTLTGGLRYGYTDQDAQGREGEGNDLLSGYLGVNWPLDEAWAITGELSRGNRLANLSERFFSGTTGRGQVLGNPDLDEEVVTGADLGLVYHRLGVQGEVHAYHQELSDFIERVALSPELSSFRNSDDGWIHGVEFSLQWQAANSLELAAGGQWQDGENDSGDTLQDLAPASLYGGLRFSPGSWALALDYTLRFSHDHVAPDEVPVDRAHLLSASLRREFESGFTLGLWARNLLDEEYRLTSDNLSTEGQERSFGVELSRVW